MKLKVHGGTASDGGNLCNSCKYGLNIQGRAENERLSICKMMTFNGVHDPYIKFPVQKCTGYIHHAHIEKHELEEIAWNINCSSSGRILGFTPPDKDE